MFYDVFMDTDIAYFLLALRIFPAQPFWVCYDAMLVADGDLKHGDEQKLEGLI